MPGAVLASWSPPSPPAQAVCPMVHCWPRLCSWGACRLGLGSRRPPEEKAVETSSTPGVPPAVLTCRCLVWPGYLEKGPLDQGGDHRCSVRLRDIATEGTSAARGLVVSSKAGTRVADLFLCSAQPGATHRAGLRTPLCEALGFPKCLSVCCLVSGLRRPGGT